MKAEDSILYYTNDYIAGRLIKSHYDLDTTVAIYRVDISEEETKELVNILESSKSSDGHRCAVVYRDAFIYNEDVYNICLSCGDYLKNDEHYYITSEGIGKLKEFKQKILDNAKNKK